MLPLGSSQKRQQRLLVPSVLESVARRSHAHAGREHGGRTPSVAGADPTQAAYKGARLGRESGVGRATLEASAGMGGIEEC